MVCGAGYRILGLAELGRQRAEGARVLKRAGAEVFFKVGWD